MKTSLTLLLFIPFFCFSQIKPDYKNSFFYFDSSIIGVSEKENLFVQSGQNLWKIDLQKGSVNLFLQTDSHIGSFDFTSNEKYIINVNTDNIIIWKKGEIYKQANIPEGIYRLKANRTNFNFAIADMESETVQILNAETGELIDIVKAKNGTIQTLYFTEDGKYLIIGTEECEVIIYDNISKSVIKRYNLQDCDGGRGIVSISSDSDNKKLLLGVRHSDTRLIDFNTGVLIKSYKSFGASTVNFNQDNKTFYEGTGIASLNYLSIIDIETGAFQRINETNTIMHYKSICLPQGKNYWLVVGAGILFIDKENNNILLEMFFHKDKNHDNKDKWWNAINYTNNKVGGSDTKYLLNNGNEILMEDGIYDKLLLYNFIESRSSADK